MVKLKNIFFVWLLPCVVFFSNKQRNGDYIMLKYAYDYRDRPVPTVIFYTDTFRINDNLALFNRYECKLKNDEFQALENIIRTKSSYLLIDTLAPAYYEFKIGKKEISDTYGTVNLTKTKEVFDAILKKLSSRKDYGEIRKTFDWVSSMLSPAGKYK